MKQVEEQAYIWAEMTELFRCFLPYALSFLVTFTGKGLAASRVMDRAVGQIGLCTGNGPVMVYADEDGQPTREPHYLPELRIQPIGYDSGKRLPTYLHHPPLRSMHRCRT